MFLKFYLIITYNLNFLKINKFHFFLNLIKFKLFYNSKFIKSISFFEMIDSLFYLKN